MNECKIDESKDIRTQQRIKPMKIAVTHVKEYLDNVRHAKSL